MIKRIVLALALAASLGGAVLACSPAATPSPSVPVVVPSVPAASNALPSNAAPSSEPSAS